MKSWILLAAVLLAPQEPKKYDLLIDAPHVEGRKIVRTSRSVQKSSTKLTIDGDVAKDEESSSSQDEESTIETLKVRAGKPAEEHWTFTRVALKKDGAATPCALVGRKILVTYQEDRKRVAGYVGGARLVDPDAAQFWDLSDIASEERPDEGLSALMKAKGPVAVGESWAPDAARIAKIFGEAMASGIDAPNSKVKLTLLAVEVRSGTPFGRIAVDLAFPLTTLGEAPLATPIWFKVSGQLDVAIDGKSPEGSTTMKIEIKGSSELKQDGPRKIVITMDTLVEQTETRTLAK